MTKHLWIRLILVTLLAGATIAEAQQIPDPRVADLARAGKLRVALFLPQYTKDSVNGAIRGQGAGTVMVQITQALAARLGVEVVLLGYPTPPKVVECLKAGACDLAFMGIEPSRAGEVGFSPPVVQLDYTYLVPAGSPIRSVSDADRPGVRIAAVRNHASTLALSRILKRAELITEETHDPAFDLLRTGRADAFASARGPLLAYLPKLPGSQVLEDRYGANQLAMAVPKGRAGRLAYISEFVEQAKASGLVQRAIAGSPGIRVAAAGYPGDSK